MSVLHTFPPGVRQALDTMRGDPDDELHEMAQKLGGPDAETAKRWRELCKLWRAERELVQVEARKLRKKSQGRQFQQAASAEAVGAALEASENFEDALEARHFLEEVRLAALVGGTDERAKLMEAAGLFARLSTVLRSIERPDLNPIAANLGERLDPAGLMLRAAPGTRVTHGATEEVRRFVRTLCELLAARYGDGAHWALIAWVCACLGYRNPRGLKYTRSEIAVIGRGLTRP